ncbi:MAG: hypothetical protein A3G33_11460 [Omnitrophica bacterium RIFCSPLOWO2_12_FULL_44_17]|uniref:Glutamate--cysteine ligase n=1 Tax=Candidatus Danuiimicrobium aquiferis TaxID=1801832 RepID=A0A1G1KRP8_9BACT|nr:MAG: hypothetical protein A3B72_09300 [Omnitrophica bacterium RIFCSPHIGHO2_02_FULL_45_28]OGW91205.1 MAG: hypothetical protein A3E74_02830 [Omnitrophica bacterium RIFCSPHIGHO2_12_FULL_44_12]OGW95606.1 MAG: hypothetical protein A3G33_11460 [Omnitrophica bacterium RIFCSPLOWO2_12_FULL_44_17]OGX03680.1 MAG: hypothetical protein A3J12_01035 [Omnitrophica bacterium RIFCSPLOWO2_02_FULL_44_11]
MSTFLHTNSRAIPIHSVEDLRGYFQEFGKPAGAEKIGIECEIFGVHSETAEALPYSGKRGVEAVLRVLSREFGYTPIQEGDRTIALQKGHTMITLEPGGQIELSGEPVRSIHEAKSQLNDFFFQLKIAAQILGKISWLACGIHPFSGLESIEWVPKKRYRIMADYLIQKGARAHDMMKRTATDQVNLDYRDEQDAIEKMRLILAVTPFAAAMFSNSAFSSGKLSGFQSERLYIWRHTDPDRTGLVLDLVCQKCTFDDYLNYVLDVPVMFVVRSDDWLPVKNLTFRHFIENGYEGIYPTREDFDLHLSTIFTDARFKHYVEVRGMDGQRCQLIPSVAAFWKGILYDDRAMKDAEKLLKPFCRETFVQLRESIEKEGLRAKMEKNCVLDYARELVAMSEAGLKRMAMVNEKGRDESIYLGPLKEEITGPGKSPADQLIESWNRASSKDAAWIIDYFKI